MHWRGHYSKCLIAAALCAGGLGPLFAQEDDDVIRVQTRLVELVVVVNGPDGPIDDLSAGEFTLVDEGVEREISDVRRVVQSRERPSIPLPHGFVSNRFDSSGTSAVSATVVLIDRLNTGLTDQMYLNGQVDAFLSSADLDVDRIGLYELSDNGLTVVADLTSEPDYLRHALEGRRPQFVVTRGDPLYDHPQYVAGMTTNALEEIVLRLSSLPGRKNVVWFAAQFPFTFSPFRDPRFWGPGAPYDMGTIEHMDEVSRLILASDVALYPVNSRGLTFFPQSRRTIDIPMRLAEMTGGRATLNSNDLDGAITEATRDVRAAYVLSFYLPEEEAAIGFHEVEVRVARARAEVFHRRGYYDSDAGARPGAGRSDEELLLSPFDATEVTLIGRAMPVGGEPGRFDISLGVDLNDIELAPVGDDWQGSVRLLKYFYDIDDGGTLLTESTYPLNVSDSELAAARAGGMFLQTHFDTAGRSGYLRLLVQDTATGSAGSIWLPLLRAATD